MIRPHDQSDEEREASGETFLDVMGRGDVRDPAYRKIMADLYRRPVPGATDKLLDDVFGRLSIKPTRGVHDDNMNLEGR